MRSALSSRLRELRAWLRDTREPVPPLVWFAAAALVSLAFFLWVRLAAIRSSPPPEPSRSAVPAPGRSPSATRAPWLRPSRPALPPDSSNEAIGARIEGWRRSFEAKDLNAYLGFYASTFGAQGRDLAAWAELRSRTFAAPDPFRVEIEDLEIDVRDAIVIATFRQAWRSGSREERGRKRLYFLAEDGAWRIFNEEWTPAGE